jgi:hypothetical protein
VFILGIKACEIGEAVVVALGDCGCTSIDFRVLSQATTTVLGRRSGVSIDRGDGIEFTPPRHCAQPD